eukprot:1895864-Rhodomonas_salina.1
MNHWHHHDDGRRARARPGAAARRPASLSVTAVTQARTGRVQRLMDWDSARDSDRSVPVPGQ